MIYFLYNSLLPGLELLLRAAARFYPRLKEFLDARAAWQERWVKAPKGALWVHVSSVGELEQIRPVIERMRSRWKGKFVLSYFSISVPRLVKDWSFVDYADYLPLDKEEDMRMLTEILRPRMLVLNRYDVWPNHLRAVTKAKVPVALVNASTPPLGLFGRLSLLARRSFFRRIHAWAFVDSTAASAWEPYVRKDAKGLVTGNPRVDRALERVEGLIRLGKARERLALWECGPCLVAGSTWRKDEELLLEALKIFHGNHRERVRLVLVPHEPHEETVRELERKIQKAGLSVTRFSALHGVSSSDILLVDQRGVLAEIYGLGFAAYVGGGFDKEVHSVIEPVAHGIPVAFGPRHHRTPEAEALAAMGAGMAVRELSVEEALRLSEWMHIMLHDSQGELHRAKEALRVFVSIHHGAGERVGDFLLSCIEPERASSATL